MLGGKGEQCSFQLVCQQDTLSPHPGFGIQVCNEENNPRSRKSPWPAPLSLVLRVEAREVKEDIAFRTMGDGRKEMLILL